MHTLDRKLLRDLWRLWTQALAISLVMAGGAATVVLAVGSYRSLEETRIAYYERQRFADVFATLERAPDRLADDIARIPGVQAMETRIVKPGLLDLDRVAAPATGLFVSLPEGRPPRVNVPYLREGRMPVRDASREVVVNEGFADAHGYSPGSEFGAILDGRRYRLRIVGIALSPEFVYATGPGDLMPDDRRFGIVWMGEAALEAIFDLEGAFSSVALTIRRDAAEADVIRRLDALLASYGGEAAHGRRDQYSHAFLDHGLDMLRAMSRTLPPIFFGVALFLVNMTLGRLVLLERGQIGLMKALGYRDLTIAMHYLKFVALLAIAGIALGWSAGALLGQYVARIYAEFFSFPDLVFAPAPDVYAVAAALPVVAGALGAVQALNRVVRLPPAVAMQPAVPPTLRAGASLGRPFGVRLPPAAAMTLRTLLVHPWRAAMTLLAISGSTAILIASLYLSDSLERLIEVKYLRVERQDATLGLSHAAPEAVVREVERLPGVLAGEAVRAVPVRVRKGSIEKRVTLYGRAVSARLHRPLDTELRPVAPPIAGLALTKWLADRLGVAPGDRIEVDLLEGRRRTVALPVMGLLEDYIGMRAVIDIQALARLMGERPLADEVEVQIDDAELDALYAKVKETPGISGISLQASSLGSFREAVAIIVSAMSSVYTGLAAVIAFGVVYNVARVALLERERDLASLRILGFGRAETFGILVAELALLVLLSQPVGWGAGYGIAMLMKSGLDADLMRMPLALDLQTYSIASSGVFAGAAASALLLWRRVRELDLVAAMKTRE